MFHTTAKLFLEYLINQPYPLSRESHEVLIQIQTLISFLPPLLLPESPKSARTVDTDELLAILKERINDRAPMS
jgi:hypothetical protein